MQSIQEVTDDQLSQVCFKDTVFLQNYGLNQYNVLDYFALSQYYDPLCLNEQIKMQARFNQLQSLDQKQMKGLEYELWYFTLQPCLFVIKRQIRHSPTKVELTGLYYIVEGTIYQSPSLAHLLSSRILTSLHHLSTGFEKVQSSVRFSTAFPQGHYLWEEQEESLKKYKKELISQSEHDQERVDKKGQDVSLIGQQATFRLAQRMNDLILRMAEEPVTSQESEISERLATQSAQVKKEEESVKPESGDLLKTSLDTFSSQDKPKRRKKTSRDTPGPSISSPKRTRTEV